MADVIDIQGKRFFTLEEARQLLPLVRRLTKGAQEEIQQLGTALSYAKEASKKLELENRIQALFKEWYQKIRKLGAEAKGLGLVDFDSGEGYYCWHYPEPELSYFHGYLDGFKGRVKVSN
jgi:hypothetical protein